MICLPAEFHLHLSGTRIDCRNSWWRGWRWKGKWKTPTRIAAAKFSACVRCSSEAVTGSFGFAEIEMIFIEIYAPFTWHIYVLDICSNVNVYVFTVSISVSVAWLLLLWLTLMPTRLWRCYQAFGLFLFLQTSLLLLLVSLSMLPSTGRFAGLMPLADNADESLARCSSACLNIAYT